MHDVQYLVMLVADFSDKQNFKGRVVFKCAYRDILCISIWRKDNKRVILELQKNAYKCDLQPAGNGNFQNPYQH